MKPRSCGTCRRWHCITWPGDKRVCFEQRVMGAWMSHTLAAGRAACRTFVAEIQSGSRLLEGRPTDEVEESRVPEESHAEADAVSRDEELDQAKQRLSRLIAGVWRGCVPDAAAHSDEEIVETVSLIARRCDDGDGFDEFELDDAKVLNARFLTGIDTQLPRRAFTTALLTAAEAQSNDS